MKFKVGDKIRMKEECWPQKEGEIYTVGLNRLQQLSVGEVDIGDDERCTNEEHWEKIPKSIRDVVVGDTVADSYGNKAKVLAVMAVMAEIFAFAWDTEPSLVHWRTFDYVEKEGWTIYQEPSDTIEVNGKKYDKDAVVERLKELPEIQ